MTKKHATIVGLFAFFLVLAGVSLRGSIIITRYRSEAGDYRIPVYYSYHIPDWMDAPFTENNTNPLLSAAVISVKWRDSNPAPGVYDWTALDKKIKDWTANGTNGKGVIIKLVPYSDSWVKDCKNTEPLCKPSNNQDTPDYIYNTVTRIDLQRKDHTVSIPKVWEPAFVEAYTAFIQAVQQKYGNDARVVGYRLGYGHLGTLNAQPSTDGGKNLVAQGWTLPIWESYIKNLSSMYVSTLSKQLILGTAPKFLGHNACPSPDKACTLVANMATAKRILADAGSKNISVVFGGMDPDPNVFQASGAPELISYLGSLNLPSTFRIGLTDDWDLWVPDDRAGCPGVTCGRNTAGFDRELRLAFQAWDSIQRKYPLFFIFQITEATATNKALPVCNTSGSSDCFRQEVYDIASGWLSSATVVADTTKTPRATRTPRSFRFLKFYNRD